MREAMRALAATYKAHKQTQAAEALAHPAAADTPPPDATQPSCTGLVSTPDRTSMQAVYLMFN